MVVIKVQLRVSLCSLRELLTSPHLLLRRIVLWNGIVTESSCTFACQRMWVGGFNIFKSLLQLSQGLVILTHAHILGASLIIRKDLALTSILIREQIV